MEAGVKLEKNCIGLGDDLICPKCGCNNLHHRMVDVYFRPEDAEHGIHTHVGYGGAKTDMDVSGNPSARRSGLFITFECEQCEGDKMLDIYQHKGTTYLEWRYD
jgi:hypothetical protein